MFLLSPSEAAPTARQDQDGRQAVGHCGAAAEPVLPGAKKGLACSSAPALGMSLSAEGVSRDSGDAGTREPPSMRCLLHSVPGSRAGTLLQRVGPVLFVSQSNREHTGLHPEPGGSGTGRCLPRLLRWES